MTNLQLLKRSELLSPLLLEDISFILTRAAEQNLTNGEVIFRKGETARCFFTVKEGKVAILQKQEDILQKQEDEKESVLAEYIAGDSFGEFDFIIGSMYKVEARAVSDSTILIFPACPHTLDSLTAEQPDTITRFYLQALILLSSRVNSIHTLISENTTWVKHFQEQLYRDQLTGLYTKFFLNTEIPRLLKLPAAILIIKPDRFKELNDMFGHKAGDAVLTRIGTEFLNIVDTLQQGWAVRLRSNEIAVILQMIEADKALDIARLMAKTITRIGPNRLSSHSQEDTQFCLTASIAISLYQQKSQDWEKVFNKTYQLMQKIWQNGGNKIYLLKSTMSHTQSIPSPAPTATAHKPNKENE